jgi:hypothetical protein
MKGPRSENIAPTQAKNSRTKEKENGFSILARETGEEEAEPSKDAQEEEARGNQTPEDRGKQLIIEEGEKKKSPQRMEGSQGIEEGEISTGSDSEGASETWATPKKTRRGRKTKKAERGQETYKDVLKGSQPTIKQLISVRHTRMQAKASQGGHSSPQGN